MKLHILDETLKRVRPISIHSSLTWNTYFGAESTFSLECPLMYFNNLNPKLNDVFIENTHDKENIGVVESIDKMEDDEGTKYLLVKGRMANVLLNRRVQLEAVDYKGTSPVDIISDLMNNNFINPKDSNRTLDLIEFDVSEQPDLPAIDYALVRGAYCGDVILDLSKLASFGFSVKLNDEGTKLKLKLYKGVNRSIDQNNFDPIIIQRKRRTAYAVNYYLDTTQKKTWAAVDKENNVPTTYPEESSEGLSGLKRKETFIDLSSVSQTITKADGTQVIIEDKYYKNMITNEAATRLSSMENTEYLDSSLPDEISKRFRESFYLGDIVTVQDDDTGLVENHRLTGAVEVWDKSGYQIDVQIGDNAVSSYGSSVAGGSSGEFNSVLEQIYRVGDIKFTTNNVNPKTYIPNTDWVLWGSGRVPVGVDTGDSNFSTVEKTGGSADAVVVSHNHTQKSHSHGTGNSTLEHFQIQKNSGVSRRNIGGSGKGYQWTTDSTTDYSAVSAVSATGTSTPTINSSGVSGTGKNLQPYITCYMWKRIA